MPADTIPHRLLQQARVRPEKPAYFVKQGGRWVPTNWAAYAREVKQAARALLALGVEPGGKVCILGFNRPEWVVMDLACMCLGGAPAGIYQTCSAAEVQYIAHHAEARVVLVESVEQWEKLRRERDRLPYLTTVVLMRGAPAVSDSLAMSWEAFLARGDEIAEARVDQSIAALLPEGVATLIYTSGTTGPPKAVMLSHRNLTWTADTARRMVEAGDQDRMLSYLPLSHIAEQMFTIHAPLSQGSPVYYAESLAKLPDNLKEVRPTIFFGVPRVWEKLHAGVAQKLGEAKGVKKRLAAWAMGVGAAMNAARFESRAPGPLLSAQYAVAERLLFRKLKAALGLDQARVCVSGAAPIAPEVLSFFTSLDLPIHEVYGQSEDTGPTSFNRPGKTRLGSVGPPLPGVEVKIAADGEILVTGPNVFLGYFKDEAATREALGDDHTLRSGDLGTFDGDGFLHITGRKKDILITAGGKNVAPKNLEAALKNHPLVSEAVIIGDRRKYLTALVALEPEAAARFVQGHGGGDRPPHEHPEILRALQRAVDRINEGVARVEGIKKFCILSRPLSVEQGELTPTLKVNRAVVSEHFANEIEAMYRD